MTQIYEIREEGLTVDLVCWAHYGRTAKVTEAVYEANPHLARLPLELPPGTRLLLPAAEGLEPEPVQPVIRLYD